MIDNLALRGTGYYFRLVVPLDLREYFGGKREVVRTLRTKDRKEAKLLLRRALYNTERLFFYMRSGMLDKRLLDKMLKGYLDDCLSDHKRALIAQSMTGIDPLEEVDLAETVQGQEFLTGREKDKVEVYRAIADGIRRQASKDLSYAMNRADKLLTKNGLTIEKGSHEYGEFCHRTAMTEALIYDTIAAREAGQDNKYDNYMDTLLNQETKITLREAVNGLVESFKVNKNVKASTLQTYIHNYNVILQYFGEDAIVNDIKNKDVEGFISDQQSKSVGNNTIKKRITYIKSILSHAAIEHDIKEPKILNKLKPDSIDVREFSTDDLNRLFLLLNGKRVTYWQQWCCVIALLTGMREGEICRISVSDIKEESGVKYIDIPESKTEAGIRKVPISDKLVELGFLDLVEARKSKNKELLFDERGYYTKVIEPIKPSKLSDWFRPFKRKLLPKEEWYCKRFHSFRHNFVNTGKQSMIPERIREEITGHEGRNKSTQEVYSSDYNIMILKEAIDKWQWNCNFRLLKMKK